MKIDHQIEAIGFQSPREAQIVAAARQPAWTLDDQDFGKIGVMPHDRLGRGLDEIGDARTGKPPLERADRRRREHDVANQPQTDEKDVVYGSIVASSISITGMSSLMGYTR